MESQVAFSVCVQEKLPELVHLLLTGSASE